MISSSGFSSSVGHYLQVTPFFLVRLLRTHPEINFEILISFSGDFFIRLLIVSRSLPSGNSLLPRSPSSNSSGNKLRILFKRSEPMEGVEPTTPRLQITCSSQLSYIGVSRFFLPVQVFPKGIAKIGIYSLSPKLFSFLFRISRKNN